jgi:hypothetical protein
MSAKSGYRIPVSMAILRLLVFVLLLGMLSPSTVFSQEASEGGAAGDNSVTELEFPGSVAGEEVAPPGQVIETVVLPPPQVPRASIYSDVNQQIPVMQVQGQYFDPSGMCSMGPLSEETTQSVRSKMTATANMGFRCFLLRVDWLAIEPEPNRVDDAKVHELLQYANEIGLKVIISLELSRAPAWFFHGETGSGRVMVSYLVDPEQERARGNDGDLRWSNGSGIPIYYHPDTIRAMIRIVDSIYNSVRDEPALIGWFLNGPDTFAYPGGGRNGVVGICDYSPYSVNRFYEATGTPLMVYPLARYSQGSWDQRAEFRIFDTLRLSWKREAFDAVVESFRARGNKHLLFVGMDPVLDYRNDNGYLHLVQIPDTARQMLRDEVNGVVINFRLASNSFLAENTRTETSAMHLSLTINQVVRNGRLAIVLIEADVDNPPSVYDIQHIAYMIKASGAYPIWCSGFIQRHGHRWSWAEKIAIERTQPLSLLPPPKRLRRGDVAILDLPQFYSMFYAGRNASLPLALTELSIHQRTGVLVELVSSYEIMRRGSVLNDYSNIVYLVPELLTQENAKSWIDPVTQLQLAGFRDSGGTIEAVDPLLLNQYVLDDYVSPEIDEHVRARYLRYGAAADLMNGADAFIVANDPYVFIRINSLSGTRWIDIKISGWPETNLASVDLINIPSGEPVQSAVASNNISFKYGPTQNAAELYILTDDYAPVARLFENRRVSVAMTQQSRQMRRSVPAALLLAALLAVTLIWMTFQSQQRSLLQAAELVDRSRKIEPIDILDQPEVMAFYRQYIHTDEEPGKKRKREGKNKKPEGHAGE